MIGNKGLVKILVIVFITGLFGCGAGRNKVKTYPVVHAVTDLSHEFSFYADHRFHRQYLPGQKGVTNWCNLYNFDFTNANLLILLNCDDRINYCDQDLNVINKFLEDGGGVVVFGTESTRAQNELLKIYDVTFESPAREPFSATGRFANQPVVGQGGSTLKFKNPEKWNVWVSDAENRPMLASSNIGKGTLLVSSRSLAGNNPNAKDSINKEIWRPLLLEIASGKIINPEKYFEDKGIEDLEYNDDHGTFKLSYNDYMKPYADEMVDVYKRSIPFVEKRMGVPLSPGMASQITLLATGGGGFSSGTVVALAVWWGGFPEREDSMIEFLTHEAVHSWVLPFAEVWNEPIATYVGNLVMMDMGYSEEALRRIEQTIARAKKHDPEMKSYDLNGVAIDSSPALNDGGKNDIHWGKSYWVFEQLRKENPNFIAEYFKLKRKFATREKIDDYSLNNTVALLSMAVGRDLFDWFNQHGIRVNRSDADIKLSF